MHTLPPLDIRFAACEAFHSVFRADVRFQRFFFGSVELYAIPEHQCKHTYENARGCECGRICNEGYAKVSEAGLPLRRKAWMTAWALSMSSSVA